MSDNGQKSRGKSDRPFSAPTGRFWRRGERGGIEAIIAALFGLALLKAIVETIVNAAR
jgi:hypothetical protein